MKTTDVPIVVEQVFNRPVSEVWKAITQTDQMTEWFFDNIPDFKAKVGFKTQFKVKTPSGNFLHLWKITEVIPQQKLVYNWKYKDFIGNSFVTFKLFNLSGKTKLRVKTNVIEDFDQSIPEFKRESCLGGWNYFIKERLLTYLEA